MRKNLFNILLVVGVFMLCAGLLIPPYLLEKRRYAKSAKEGRALIPAVYAYKDKTGAWPKKLDDLVPDFLPALPVGWHYRWSEGYSPELTKLDAGHTELRYYFPPAEHTAFQPGADAGWIGSGGGGQTYLGADL